MAYDSYILAHAKREIKKLPDRNIQGRILFASVITLADDPRPPGYRQLEGQKDLFRLRVGDYRIIYSILDHCEAVIIVSVRPRDKGTYKNIPRADLSAKIKELEEVTERKKLKR